MTNARARNVGWRIDYFLISVALRPRLKRAFIRAEICGSDHCPVGIEIGCSGGSESSRIPQSAFSHYSRGVRILRLRTHRTIDTLLARL